MSKAETSAKPDTAAMKKRIIDHMNADHQDSLVRFLKHYASLSSRTARHARLIDVSLSSLTISSSTSALPPTTTCQVKQEEASEHLIPLDPPLASYTEFRQRLVDMDGECCAKLGRSDITVKAYIPQQGFVQILAAIICLFTFLIFGYRRKFQGGGWVGDAWGMRQHFTGVWKWMWKAQPWVFWPMVVGHGAQAWHMDRTRLQKHSVPRFSALWWQWMISTFVRGFKNFERFDALVKQEWDRKQKTGH